jgi:hypothetical protein
MGMKSNPLGQSVWLDLGNTETRCCRFRSNRFRIR